MAAEEEAEAAPTVAHMETGEVMVIEEEVLTVVTEEVVTETLTEAVIEAHTEVVVVDTTIVEVTAMEIAVEVAAEEAVEKAVTVTAVIVVVINEAIPILVAGLGEIRIASLRPKSSVSRMQVKNSIVESFFQFKIELLDLILQRKRPLVLDCSYFRVQSAHLRPR